jgi:general secretion pathway protein G
MVNMKKRIELSRGFTLIELLVVLAIIGLLVSLAAPRYFHTIERAKETALHQDLAVMRDAIDKYYGDVGKYPDELSELVEKKYLRVIPKDPITNKNDTWTVVAPEGDVEGNVFNVKSGAEGTASDGSNFVEW